MTHPPEDLLLDYAAGHCDRTRRLVVEAHCARCESCSETLHQLAAPGGTLLLALPEEQLPSHLWHGIAERAFGAAEAEDEEEAGPPHAIPLPAALRALLPAEARPAGWRWHRLWPRRVSFAVIDHADTGGFLAVLRGAPGHRVPRHTHLGLEEVVVLAGGYEDAGADYRPGDYIAYPAGTSHAPRVDTGEECWLLLRFEAPVRFHGPRGLAQRLLGR